MILKNTWLKNINSLIFLTTFKHLSFFFFVFSSFFFLEIHEFCEFQVLYYTHNELLLRWRSCVTIQTSPPNKLWIKWENEVWPHRYLTKFIVLLLFYTKEILNIFLWQNTIFFTPKSIFSECRRHYEFEIRKTISFFVLFKNSSTTNFYV